MLMSSNCAREHLTVSLSCLTAWFSSSMWAVLSSFENEMRLWIITLCYDRRVDIIISC